jgi:hypothetical protein
LTRAETFFKNLHSERLSGNGAEEKICGFIDEISRIDFKRMPYYRVIRERLDGVPHRDLCTFGYTGVYVGCDLKVFPCWQGEGREIGSLFDDDIVEKWFSEDAREKVLATRREHCEQCLVERHKNMFVNVREYCRHPLRFIGLALMHVVRRR